MMSGLFFGVLSVLAAVAAKVLADDARTGIPKIATALILRAASRLPAEHQDRWREEWLAALGELEERTMAADKEWQDHVKGILKAELKRKNVNYRQLAEKLGEMGVQETELNIKNKLSGGGFSAVFFVQCLEAIGLTELRLR